MTAERRLLRRVARPADLRGLTRAELGDLAAEIRDLLVEQVSRTGGHLGPSLGVVELTIALHRVFDSPHDKIVWDTGHQAYVHKALTGRWRDFGGLRQRGGLSGYPSRAESPHDVVENSHASTALSHAYGIAKGFALAGVTGRRVVAVIGDGALGGGMAWEALNAIAGEQPPGLVVVLNDNGRAYSPTVGGLAGHLRDRDAGTVFESLGLRYTGPIDGHDVEAVEEALRTAAVLSRPTVVHCVTRKGHGYHHAENDEADRFHAVRPMDPATGLPLARNGTSWTSVFSDEMVRLGLERTDVVAITAAMCGPTGLSAFAGRFPGRLVDAGIAEQHAVTSAAGLAAAGLRPVVALYSTFFTRALDQALMDVALHGHPVVFVLDRAGVTGDDGPSHNGMWDLSLLHLVPGLAIAAPRDAVTLRAALRTAVSRVDGPSAVRFPKGEVVREVPAAFRYAGMDVLRPDPADDVLLLSAGAMAERSLAAAALLDRRGIGVTVVDPRWLKPVNPALVTMSQRFRLVATVEDGLRTGGFGAAVAQELRDAGVTTPVLTFGIPQRFLDHGTRAQVLADCRLTPEDVAADVAARLLAPAPWLTDAETSGAIR
ncbi:1-deoxy-D-xylulose-5-phosphate synthase [Lentzea sp. NPDC005914]|uniref:1-deoxy-D-xylulose-5-phosphate synthase n=1 Tax=Lentzea sp. NPDC005914 TaxID=3154572 RepID=UPI00340787E8